MIELPASVSMEPVGDHIPVLKVEHPSCRARISLLGAQVLEWTPAGEEPMLYLSPNAWFTPGKAIRGGVPVCWPWFGPHPTDSSLPAHGFARIAMWELIRVEDDGESVALAFELRSSEWSRKFWPHEFQLMLEMRLGSEMHLSLVTHHGGGQAFAITSALHAYWRVTEVESIAIHGLEGAPYREHAGGANEAGEQAGEVMLCEEMDRIYDTSGAITLHDLDRVVKIHKQGSASTIVWNPWMEKGGKMADLPADGYREFVCIEPANAPGREVTLASGGTQVLKMRVEVSRS